MRVSVVINTYNRSAALRQTLLSLRQQLYRDFEVIVVNGPSTDDTEVVLQPLAASIKIVNCPEPQLARSRNLGILAATGDIVAFIDDDAVPEPNWLGDLTAAYSAPSVGAVGGIVYDHTGTRLQNKYACCYRHGEPQFHIEPPFDDYTRSGADPFLYLQGTNMSYSRKVLETIAGFDENILHYYDDVETCLQVIDRGYLIRALPNAAVHHKYLPSHIRNHSRIMLDPYRYICDNAYFAFRYGQSSRSQEEIEQTLMQKIAGMKSEAASHLAAGRFSEDQYGYYTRRLEEGIQTGKEKGLNLARAGKEITPADPASFLPFALVLAAEKRLKLCWIATDYPSTPASEWILPAASAGHELHVVTLSDDNTYRLDMDEGVWIHRLPTPIRWCPEVEGRPVELMLKQRAFCYGEICKIHDSGRIDLIALPLDDALGSVSCLDPRFPIVQAPKSWNGRWSTVENHFRTIIDLHRSSVDRSFVERNYFLGVQAKWAKLLRDSLKCSSRVARPAAKRLLNPARFLVDYTAEVRELWRLSETDCLKEVCRLLLGRLPTTDEIQHWLGVAHSRSMVDVVRHLATSLEARNRSLPTDWVHELIPALSHREPGNTSPTSGFRRFQNRLMRLPVFGKIMRLAGRLPGFTSAAFRRTESRIG